MAIRMRRSSGNVFEDVGFPRRPVPEVDIPGGAGLRYSNQAEDVGRLKQNTRRMP